MRPWLIDDSFEELGPEGTAGPDVESLLAPDDEAALDRTAPPEPARRLSRRQRREADRVVAEVGRELAAPQLPVSAPPEPGLAGAVADDSGADPRARSVAEQVRWDRERQDLRAEQEAGRRRPDAAAAELAGAEAEPLRPRHAPPQGPALPEPVTPSESAQDPEPRMAPASDPQPMVAEEPDGAADESQPGWMHRAVGWLLEPGEVNSDTAEPEQAPAQDARPVPAEPAEAPIPAVAAPVDADPPAVTPGADLSKRLALANAAAMARARSQAPVAPVADVVEDDATDGDADAVPRDPRRRRLSVRTLTKTLIVIAIPAVAAVLLRAFVVAPYYIPSASMEPSLHGCKGCNNDHVLVDKLSYKLHDLRRGDVVVFNRPKTWLVSDKVLIKRVIGLPGDVLTDRKGIVFVNGLELQEPYVNAACAAGTASLPQNGITVADGQAFVMGDNRCDSSDSRRFGAIPASSVIGRAFVIIWPLGRLHWL